MFKVLAPTCGAVSSPFEARGQYENNTWSGVNNSLDSDRAYYSVLASNKLKM